MHYRLQGFLTAVKQEVSRKHAADKWALDDVVLASEVTHPAKVLTAADSIQPRLQQRGGF